MWVMLIMMTTVTKGDDDDAYFSCPKVWEHFVLSLLFSPHPEALKQ